MRISKKHLGLMCAFEWTEQKNNGAGGMSITTHILVGRLNDVDDEKFYFLRCLHRTHVSSGNWGNQPVWEECKDFVIKRNSLLLMQPAYFNTKAQSNSIQQYFLGRDRRYGLWETWPHVRDALSTL